MSQESNGQAPEPQYAQPPAGQPYAPAPGQQYVAVPMGPRTNVLAILSLVFSCLGAIFILPFIGSVAGVVMGHLARKQIPTTGEQGDGLAKAGLIVGYVGFGLLVLGLLAYFGFIFFMLAVAGTSSSY